MNNDVRMDKWLWAARFFKTRALAARACELGRITSNGQPAKSARPVRDFEKVVLGERRGKRGAIHDFRAVEREAAAILRIAAFHRHHDAEAADRGVHDRPEGLQIAAIFLAPPIEQIVRRDRALAGQERRDLVVLQDDRAVGIDDEAGVEEAVRPIRVPAEVREQFSI